MHGFRHRTLSREGPCTCPPTLCSEWARADTILVVLALSRSASFKGARARMTRSLSCKHTEAVIVLVGLVGLVAMESVAIRAGMVELAII